MVILHNGQKRLSVEIQCFTDIFSFKICSPVMAFCCCSFNMLTPTRLLESSSHNECESVMSPLVLRSSRLLVVELDAERMERSVMLMSKSLLAECFIKLSDGEI